MTPFFQRIEQPCLASGALRAALQDAFSGTPFFILTKYVAFSQRVLAGWRNEHASDRAESMCAAKGDDLEQQEIRAKIVAEIANTARQIADDTEKTAPIAPDNAMYTHE